MRSLVVAKRKRRGMTRRTPTLLELPFDIRHRILQYLLSTDLEENSLASYGHEFSLNARLDRTSLPRENSLNTYPIEFLKQDFRIDQGYELYPNILWTCKQLLSEGTMILVEENKYIALRYPVEVDSATIIAFILQSGVGTFWVEPGIFKSPTGEYGKPVVTLDVVSSHPGSSPSDILLIVGLEHLRRVCQGLSGFKAHNVVYPRFNTPPLRVNVDIRVSSFPAWKAKGFRWLVDYLKANIFDWIGDSVDQISCSGPVSELKLEKNLRSWILRQGSAFDAVRSIGHYERTFDRLVRRFRKAENQFLSNDSPSAIASLLELNALIGFSFDTFLNLEGQWPVYFFELYDWIHFYLGMSLLEEADRARGTPEYEYYQHTHFRGAAYYLPSLLRMSSWNNVTPGHKARWRLAKAELSCLAKVTDRTRRHLTRLLHVMENNTGSIDCSQVRELHETTDLTFAEFTDAKEGLRKLIGDIFGPMKPVELKRI